MFRFRWKLVESSTVFHRPHSTVALPRHYSVDTIIMDILEDPEATEVLQPLVDAFKETLVPLCQGSEAAKEAVSDEMTMAMLKYMPLRGALSFGGGNIQISGIQGLLGMPAEEDEYRKGGLPREPSTPKISPAKEDKPCNMAILTTKEENM